MKTWYSLHISLERGFKDFFCQHLIIDYFHTKTNGWAFAEFYSDRDNDKLRG